MRILSLFVLAGTLALAAASCGGDDEATQKGPVPIDQLRGAFEVANCDFEVRCSWMPDTTTCLRVDKADYELVQLIADAALGKVAYDEKAGRTWVEAIRNQACEVTLAVKNTLEAAWQPVFIGNVKVGGACFVDDECAGTNTCDKTGCGGNTGCCAGVCAAPTPPAKTGEACGGAIGCNDADFCGDDGSGMQVCVERSDNGLPCVNDYGCKDGQFCDTAGAGSCYKLSPPGSPCNPSLAYSCFDYNTWCDTAQKKCVALPKAGQPCGTNGNYCALWTWCDINGDKTCKPLPVEGQDCLGDRCLGDLICSDSKCAQPTGVNICAGTGEGNPGTGGAGGGG